MGAKTIPQLGETFEGEDPFVVKALRVDVGSGLDVDPTATGTFNLFDLNDTDNHPVRVVDLQWQVTERFDDDSITSSTSVQLTIGDGDDVDGFADNTDLSPDDTDTHPQSARLDSTQPYQGGKIYEADDTIDLQITGAAPTESGQMEVVLFYVQGLDD